MVTERAPSLAADVVLILLAALVAGLAEATLIATHRIAGVDPFHYVPARIWWIVPLAWVAIATALVIPAYLVSRRRGAVIVLCAVAATFAGCRIALFSRKWGLLALVVIFVALLWMSRRLVLPRLRRAGLWLTVLLALVAGAVAAVIPRAASPKAFPAADGPNVLIVFADTLRHDAVFLPSGEVRPELPALRRFAGESTVFDAAYAASSWTLPSHFAAVTGLEAHQLGLDFEHQTFGRPVMTLAERFRRQGYRTAAVISNPFLHEASGFARGFASYEHAARVMDLCRAAPLTLLSQVWPRFAGTVCGWSGSQVTERALRHMKDEGAPYFVVLNFMEAHEPSYLEPDCRAGAPRRHNTVLRLQVREPPLYHAAVRCLDKRLGALFDRAAANTRDTIVIFTSDHGEHLHDRGQMGHGSTLYPEVLHVPLMMRTPDRKHSRVTTPVSLTQLSSLVRSRDVAEQPVIATLTHTAAAGGRRDISVIRGAWQLITTEKGLEELIDLRSGKTVRASPVLPQLRADTAAVRRAWPRLPATDFRSIGYIQ